jgi:hypothetical protein
VGCEEAHILDAGPAALCQAGVCEGLSEAVAERGQTEGHIRRMRDTWVLVDFRYVAVDGLAVVSSLKRISKWKWRLDQLVATLTRKIFSDYT